MEMWYDKNNDIENLRKEDFMRKKIYGIATALALAMGCSLFLTYPVQAAEDTVIIKQYISVCKNIKKRKDYEIL